jgi:hypothetical protein
MMPPAIWDRLREARAEVTSAHMEYETPASSYPAEFAAPQRPIADRIVETLQAELAHIGRPQEYAWMQLFLEDMDRLLCLVEAGPQDRVYLPMAHAREAFALRQLVDSLTETWSPQFLLAFHEELADLEDGLADSEMLTATLVQRVYFDAVRGYPDTTRLCFVVATPELQASYSHLAGVEFGLEDVPTTGVDEFATGRAA